jgi:hypothetical protein
MTNLSQTTGDANRLLDAVKAVIRLSPAERRELLRILREELPELWAEVAKEGTDQ